MSYLAPRLAHRALLALILFQVPLPIATAQAPLPEKIEFNRDIRPILSNLCYHCHGPDKTKRKADLRFDTRGGLFAKHDDITIVQPGKPGASELYRRITSRDDDERMPPSDSKLELTPRQTRLIERWIRQGATWQDHWSFTPPRRHTPPPVRDTAWPRNPVDHFVLSRLEAAGLAPSQPASPTTQLRRLYLDLTGLPPTPRAITAYLADRRPGAYERVVDHLLSSPRHGEHHATTWLDAARYADTSGYQNDGPRDMWRWRDWVLAAINGNMPFDQFTIEQLAGDLLLNPTLEQKIATGFNRNHRGNSEGGVIAEEYQVEYVVDRVDTTATVWLGLTLKCARCHEHKYDPFTQQEFYGLYAFFNNISEYGRAIKVGNSPPFIKAPTAAQQQRQQSLAQDVARQTRSALKLEPRLAQAQRAWEAGEARTLPASTDWSVSRGLVAHFPCDGKRANRLAPDKPAKPIDGTPASKPGRVAGALSLQKGTFLDAGDVGKFGYFDAFSLTAWIRPSRTESGTLLSRMADTERGAGYSVDFSDGHLRINLVKRWLDDSVRVQSQAKLAANTWHHVAVTYDGSRLAAGVRLYLNGKPAALKTNLDLLNQDFASTEPLRLGGGGGPTGRYNGLLDEVRIYDRDLSHREAGIVSVADNIPVLIALAEKQRSPRMADKLRDYYVARHAGAPHREIVEGLATLLRRQRSFLDSLPTVMVMQERVTPRQTFLLERGQYDHPLEAVLAGTPSRLPPLPRQAPVNRLGLARWLISTENPLTARVTVNRAWQGLFGIGLVRTTEDFGSQGERPSHPAMLDWLATELVRNGWDIKALLRLLVTSQTYRQSSRITPALLERDPQNRLLARAPRRRLSAEVIRDQALFAAGLLTEHVGGPSVRPYQPAGLWKEIASTTDYNQAHGASLYRRSLYTYWKRTVTPPTMATFDASSRETCRVRPSRTNTPLQALTLMNDITFVESARVLAERVLSEPLETDSQRIDHAFLLTASRWPRQAERRVLLESLANQRKRFQASPKAATQLASAGEYSRRENLAPAEVAAWTTIAGLLLNLDETISRE